MHIPTSYLLLGMVAFWFVLLTVIFRLEKRMVWPYSELDAAPQFPDSSGYALRCVADAAAVGFTLLGWARDLKGPKYRASYAMLISAERDIFAVIGAGSILNIPLAATWLYTPTADGRTFYSTDNQTAVQIDLSHDWTNQLVPAATFPNLLEEHRGWIRSNGLLPRPFTRDRELAEFRTVRQQHFRSMEHAGLIAFTDGSATHFHFTLSGALRTATWSYLVGMARRLSRGRLPRNA